MTSNQVNGSGNRLRSGAQTLSLLASPINCLILQALAEGPKQQTDLRRAAGSPAQTTLRAQLKKLCKAGAIERQRHNGFPGGVEHELTDAGRELLRVAETVEGWLGRAPDGPLSLGDAGAKAALKSLAEGWSTAMLRALAAKPLSLTELDRVIAALNYPSLERRLAAMKLAGQVEPAPGNGRGTPYMVTGWARQAVGPLAAAARWERRYLVEGTPPLGKLDVEAFFLLALPLLRLPGEAGGACRLVAEIPNNGQPRGLAGAIVAIDAGRVVSCTTRLEGNPDAWASGSASAWLTALIERDVDQLELGGDGRLARSLLDGLHESLFTDSLIRRTY